MRIASVVLVAFIGVAHGAPAAPAAACQMKTTFPDHASFEDTCLVTVVLPGQVPLAPKGWIKFLDSNEKTQVFSLNFYPPAQLKPHTPYIVTTDNVDSFLSGIVQPGNAQEQCRMTKKFPTSGTVTFSAVGTTAAELHGTVVVYPACYLNFGTPQQTLVPGGQQGGASTTVVF